MKLFKSNFSFFRCLLAVASIFCITSCSSPDEENTIVGSNSAKVEADDYSKIADALAKISNGSLSGDSQDGMGDTDCTPEPPKIDPATKKTVVVDDGLVFRNLIKEYDSWYKVNKKGLAQCTHPSATQAILDKMRAQFGLSIYSENDKGNIIGQVINRYKSKYCSDGKITLPTDNNSTLKFLAFQRQCKEFLNRLVKAATNKDAPTYTNKSSYILKDQKKARVGMLLYRNDNGHCGFISKLAFKADGSIWYLTIKEANWGTGLEKNPYGQLPWARTVTERTTSYKDANGKPQGDTKFVLSDYSIVTLDKQ